MSITAKTAGRSSGGLVDVSRLLKAVAAFDTARPTPPAVEQAQRAAGGTLVSTACGSGRVLAHPAVAPTDVVVALMNAAQEIMTRELVQARLNRLWQPSAYVGSYGDLASPQIRKYIENWASVL